MSTVSCYHLVRSDTRATELHIAGNDVMVQTSHHEVWTRIIAISTGIMKHLNGLYVAGRSLSEAKIQGSQ